MTHRRRFRGSRLDHLLGNTLAVAAVAIPPFVFGTWGFIQSLVFVNGFLLLSLLRPQHVRRGIRTCAAEQGLVVVDGMGQLTHDFLKAKDHFTPDVIRTLSVSELNHILSPFGQTGTGMTASVLLPVVRGAKRKATRNKSSNKS